MNLYLRLLVTTIRALFEKHISTLDNCEQWFRVWPGDLDLFLHMNNGRYLQIMDVARFRWLLRTGTISAIKTMNWKVALGGNMTRYRRPLQLFARYRVVTRLLCWDERWFFLEHAFTDKKGRQIAVGLSRAAFRDARGWVPAREVMQIVEPGASSGDIPQYLRKWLVMEESMSICAEKFRINGYDTNVIDSSANL